MILHEQHIKYKYGDVFKLKPIADWHLGHTYCDEKAIKAYLEDGKDDPYCYLVGVGDLLDSIIITDKRYSKDVDASPNESNDILAYQRDRLLSHLQPYEGRILGLGIGNHERTVLTKNSYHIIRDICKQLHTISLGYQWGVRVVFRENGGRGRTVNLFGHHGWGGGTRTEGGSITKYSNHALRYEADIFFYGHDHQRKQNSVEFMGICGKKFIPKQKRIFFPGTFLKTFSKTDEPTWAETRGFNPVTVGGVNVFIKPNGEWVDIWSDL